MLHTTIIPDNTLLQINIPENYVGKKVYAIFYVDDEITQINNSTSTKKPSDFFGTLSSEEGANMHKYLIKSREEWDRNI